MCGRGGRGWLDLQMVLAVMLLNLVRRGHRAAGARPWVFRDPARDREGFAVARGTAVVEEPLSARTRADDALAVGAVGLVDPNSPKASAGTAFIPAVTKELEGLWRVNQALLAFLHNHQPARSATLDMDATLIETHKREALYCYKKFKAYQPLNCWWAEQGAMLDSEFRDGNVPAGHEHCGF
jgi:hypothetical protein